jgi:hypothetical protein
MKRRAYRSAHFSSTSSETTFDRPIHRAEDAHAKPVAVVWVGSPLRSFGLRAIWRSLWPRG